LVVASTLMSMGMIMLPPVMISIAVQVDPLHLGRRLDLMTRQIVLSFR
jgi:flagellar biosynthesis protein FliP